MEMERVTDFLSSQGIDLEEDELKHYGVKGMKWGKTLAKGDESGGGGGVRDEDLTKPKAGMWDSTVKEYSTVSVNGGRAVTTSRTTKVQGQMNRFIEQLFVDKKITKNGRTTVKQGAINKFIEKSLNNLLNKVTKTNSTITYTDPSGKKKVMK